MVRQSMASRLPVSGPVRTVLSMIADARVEPGHFTSGGLGTIATPLTSALVASYLDTRLRTCVRVDAAAAVVALRTLDSHASLDLLQRVWLARTASPVLRAAAVTAGRSYLGRLRVRWPNDPATVAVSAIPDPPRPLVVAAIGAAVGLSAVQVAWLVAQDDVQTVTVAAGRLAGLSPQELGGVESAVTDAIADLVRQVTRASAPADLPVVPALALEQWIRRSGRPDGRAATN
jgi:urease accessory protein